MIVRLLRGPSGREWLGAHSHEVLLFGFWPGDDTIGGPACCSDTAQLPGPHEQALPADQP